MALRMISSGPSALALYHSLQSCGLVRRREPVCFTLESEHPVDCVLINIQGLNHLVDGQGHQFLFDGWAVDEGHKITGGALGYYNARARKGHVVTPAGIKEDRVAEVRARVHMMHLDGSFTQRVAEFARKTCRSHSLGKAAPARIMEELGLDYYPGPDRG